MIGIAAIAYEIPAPRLDNASRAEALHVLPETLDRRIGVRQVARMEPGQDTSDLCVRAADKLFATGLVRPEEIDCLMVVTQNPDGAGLPHTSAILHGKLKLPEHCAAFDIGLGCSGFVYGLSIARSFMEANGLKRGLLFTADPYSKVINEQDKRTALLFGDAAAVTLLSDQPLWQIGAFDFGTVGSRGDALEVRLTDDGKLHMNGRAVLAFSVGKVPDSIRRAMERNGIAGDQVDRVVLHQGSRVVVEDIARALRMQDRTGFYIQDYGNVVSSSIPIVLADQLQPDDRHVVISGFGVGLSWASTVLTRLT
jgi:3-oxoacyl-[acyl-carrier-protein] synthase-3